MSEPSGDETARATVGKDFEPIAFLRYPRCANSYRFDQDALDRRHIGKMIQKDPIFA